MKRALLLGAAAMVVTIGVAAALPAAPARAAAAARDWTRTVVATPEGGFRMGNPNAAVKLVEYGSLTCNHCAHFAAEGEPRLLAKYVQTGKVSFEFRNFVRDPYDLTAALLSRCAGPAGFFALTRAYMTTQPQWIAKYTAMDEAQMAALNALPEAQRPWRIATIGGLSNMAAKAGVPAMKARQCVNDAAGVKKLVEMRQAAVKNHQVAGTPTFIVNGRTVEAHDWGALEPLLGPPVG